MDRFGYVPKKMRVNSPRPRRGLSVTSNALLSSTFFSSIPSCFSSIPSCLTRSSMSSTVCSASSLRPRVISQRGLSGMVRRRKMMTRPSTGPMKKPIRQPQLTGTWLEKRYSPRAEPIAAPAQYVPLTAMSMRPR